MGKRRRRRLGPEDRRLWDRVAATTSPLHPKPPRLDDRSTAVTPPPAAAPRPVGPPEPARDAPHASRAPSATYPSRPAPVRPIGPSAVPEARVTYATPEALPVGRPQAGLDRRTADRLRKGSRAPDARIDLHGMTAERAHRACLRFLADAAAQGHRVVLVITGKGRRDEHGHVSGRGVLRESLPGWLRASPLGHSIVGIYQAHRRHGGEGAFYVYLKRHR